MNKIEISNGIEIGSLISELLGSVVLGATFCIIAISGLFQDGDISTWTIVIGSILGGVFGFFTSSRIVCVVGGLISGIMFGIKTDSGFFQIFLFGIIWGVLGWIGGRIISYVLTLVGTLLGSFLVFIMNTFKR